MISSRAKITLSAVLLALTISVLVACDDTAAPAVAPPAAVTDTPTIKPEGPTSEPTAAISGGWTSFTSEAEGFSFDTPGEPQASSILWGQTSPL